MWTFLLTAAIVVIVFFVATRFGRGFPWLAVCAKYQTVSHPTIEVPPECPLKVVQLRSAEEAPYYRALYALYHPPGTADQPTIVYYQEIGAQLGGSTREVAERFVALGYGFLAIEYHGYGITRKPSFWTWSSEEVLYEDAECAIELLIRDERPSRIILMGYSLGTGVAVEMAHRGHGHALVLVAPYTSVPELVLKEKASEWVESIVFPTTRVLVGDRFEIAAKAPQISLPTLILHGTADKVVPYRMSERLTRLFPLAQLVQIPNGTHGLWQADQGDQGDQIFKPIGQFIDTG